MAGWVFSDMQKCPGAIAALLSIVKVADLGSVNPNGTCGRPVVEDLRGRGDLKLGHLHAACLI
jgi:hypothetical protein